MKNYELCLIVPCYNEEHRLNLNTFKNYLAKNPNRSFLFVNDGSVDNTEKILANFISNLPNAYF